MVLLALSAASIALAPTLMPDTYSWTSHTTSESAAQGVDGAWLARLGFLLLGLAVIWLAVLKRASWGSWGMALHLSFGALMIATAAFSTRPWEQGAGFDRTEDDLHSIASTGVGLSFAFGVLAVSLTRGRNGVSALALDVIAIAVAGVALPISMSIWGEADGILQRAIFLIAYAWYAAEALRQSDG
ncbi:MAG TPA: DUF998 domain-containing protein [Solirubrobacterales bacterium]